MSNAKTITDADSPYTLGQRHYFVLCDCSSGPITVNLPAASLGYPYMIAKTDSSANAVTIDGDGSETINGATTMVLSTQWHSVTLTSDKTQYIVKTQSNDSIRIDNP